MKSERNLCHNYQTADAEQNRIHLCKKQKTNKKQQGCKGFTKM